MKDEKGHYIWHGRNGQRHKLYGEPVGEMKMLTYEHIIEGSWEPGEIIDGWQFVEMFYGDKWRWGMWEHYVYRRLEDSKLFQFDLQRSHGDSEDWWNPADICTSFAEVKVIKHTKTAYKPVKS